MEISIFINNEKIFSFGWESKGGYHMEKGKYNALDVAKYIVKYVNEDGTRITHLQLQKILYYIQAEFLVVQRRPLFIEPIEAWRHGPVVKKVYSYYRRYTSIGITDASNPEISFSDDEMKIIERIVDSKKTIDGWELVNHTHSESPWINTYDNGKGENEEISLLSIRRYFVNQKVV